MKNAVQLSAFSTEPIDIDQVVPDRRRQNRHIAMLRLAKIKAEFGEGWGFIKNLSATGMMVEVHSGFDLGNRISATLNEEQELSGIVRWREQSRAGVEFSEPIDVAKVLAKPDHIKSGRIPRLPRIEMQHPVNLYHGSQIIPANICDISPAGICVRTDYCFEVGKSLKLSVPELQDIQGTVRWQSGDRVGIVFSQRLPLDDMMIWLSTFHNADTINSGGLVALDKAEEKPNSVVPTPDGLPYQVIGHDERDKEILIDKVDSATDALVQFKATSKFFSNVSIRNADNVALSIGEIVLRAYEEERGAAKTQLG